jgi:hypothetical protein
MARPAVHDWGEPPPPRTSPLYCRYHGFLIGHGLALAFCDGAAAGYDARRRHLQATLRELDIDAEIPESPADRGTATYASAVGAVLPRLARESRELAEFAVLGGLLARYAIAVASEAVPGAAGPLGVEIERLRSASDLPPIDPLRHGGRGVVDPDCVLAPALTYLAEIVARADTEPDTAIALVPATAPSDADYEGFHRPALEHGGYRALRVWDGLGGAAAADLLLALLGKAGLLWADVSTLDAGVVAAIGAAQALGRPGMIVARADRPAIPPRIGRDAVIRYDPTAADWPEGPALLMAACVAGLTLGAERGDPVRLAPGPVEDAFDDVSRRLGQILLPPDAREAQRRGRRALDAGDLLQAEAAFSEAYRLGLHDDETRLWRGWARLGLGRFEAAADDLVAVLRVVDGDGPAGEWRPIAAYLRAVLREAQGDLRGALHDFELALSLGLSDAEVRDKRDALAARVAVQAAGR